MTDREIALELAGEMQRSARRVTDPKLRTTLNAWAGTLKQHVKPSRGSTPSADGDDGSKGQAAFIRDAAFSETRYY